MDNDLNNVLEVSNYATDTVYAFIQLKENFDAFDVSSDIQTEYDDFMIREQQRQRGLIAHLSNLNLDIITDNLLDKLRDKQPIIDLSLLPED